MVTAAEQDEDRTPAVWEAEVVGVERRSVEVAVFEVVAEGLSPTAPASR